jgi:hypothetical protein
MADNKTAIKAIRDSGSITDAEVLARIFSDPTLSDDGTTFGRLRAILDATEHTMIPGLQTGIAFHDSGFAVEFKDPWPSSDNQVGHFLTAVGLSFDPSKLRRSVIGKSMRDWLNAPPSYSDEEVAVRLCVGHEKSPDPSAGTAAAGGIVGGITGGLAGAAAGAAMAIVDTFRQQFAAATTADIAVFRSAVAKLGTGSPLNKVSASAEMHGITVIPTGRGNSYQDLLLTIYGWRLGQTIKIDNPPKSDITSWVRTNLM